MVLKSLIKVPKSMQVFISKQKSLDFFKAFWKELESMLQYSLYMHTLKYIKEESSYTQFNNRK